MVSITLITGVFLAGLSLAMLSSSNPTPAYMVAIRNYSPVESRKPRPFTVITENLGRDANFGHLKGLEVIVREGMEVVIFTKSFFAESGKNCLYLQPVLSTDLNATNIMNPSVPIHISRFYRVDGKKNTFRKVDYAVCDPSDKTAFVFQLQNNFPPSHDLRFQMILENLAQPVSLVPFDAGSLGALQKAYRAGCSPITRDSMLSFVRLSTHSANPSAMLMILYLSDDELEVAFFKLIRAVISSKRLDFVTSVALKRQKNVPDLTPIILFMDVVPQAEHKSLLMEIFSQTIGLVSEIAVLQDNGKIPKYNVFRVKYGPMLLTTQMSRKKTKGRSTGPNDLPIKDLDHFETVMNDVSPQFSVISITRSVSDEPKSQACVYTFAIPRSDKKKLFMAAVKRFLFSDTSKYGKLLSCVEITPSTIDNDMINLVLYFNMVSTELDSPIYEYLGEAVQEMTKDLMKINLLRFSYDNAKELSKVQARIKAENSKTESTNQKPVRTFPGNFDEHSDRDNRKRPENGILSLSLEEFEVCLERFTKESDTIPVEDRLTFWIPYVIVNGSQLNDIFPKNYFVTGVTETLSKLLSSVHAQFECFQLSLVRSSTTFSNSATSVCTTLHVTPQVTDNLPSDLMLKVGRRALAYTVENKFLTKFFKIILELGRSEDGTPMFKIHLNFPKFLPDGSQSMPAYVGFLNGLKAHIDQ